MSLTMFRHHFHHHHDSLVWKERAVRRIAGIRSRHVWLHQSRSNTQRSTQLPILAALIIKRLRLTARSCMHVENSSFVLSSRPIDLLLRPTPRSASILALKPHSARTGSVFSQLSAAVVRQSKRRCSLCDPSVVLVQYCTVCDPHAYSADSLRYLNVTKY